MQSDQSQWTGGYYGYAQGHPYAAYAPPTQDPNTYYGGYGGAYGNYQQPGAYQQPQQVSIIAILASSPLIYVLNAS